MNHRDWYEQRYASILSKHQEKIQEKAERYVVENELKRQRKKSNIANAELIFSEHAISYQVCGHAWLVKIGNEQLYFYPSTNKWRPKGIKTIYHSRSAADFIGKVVRFQSQQG